jgi:hypothetical protein
MVCLVSGNSLGSAAPGTVGNLNVSVSFLPPRYALKRHRNAC